eukprot:430009-Pelagomonas_calceolata.AAC.2
MLVDREAQQHMLLVAAYKGGARHETLHSLCMPPEVAPAVGGRGGTATHAVDGQEDTEDPALGGQERRGKTKPDDVMMGPNEMLRESMALASRNSNRNGQEAVENGHMQECDGITQASKGVEQLCVNLSTALGHHGLPSKTQGVQTQSQAGACMNVASFTEQQL